MKERLQKIIAARGLASRRKAEELILQGRVRCNGKAANLGDQADPGTDEITVDGKPLPALQENVYLMLNKPKGYVTTLSDERGRANAAQLVADCGQRVYPVGRLDMDSEGLLLFTNDGEFANQMMHPRHEIRKSYDVWVSHYRVGAELELLKPITLDGYTIRTPEVSLYGFQGDKALIRVIIHEGRNRQVRRMCQAVGMTVTKLRRVAEGQLQLGDLPLGKWRYLSRQEVEQLKNQG